MQTDEDFNVKFVQIVENHRCLYDKKVPEYRNKDYQEQSWLEISKEARESVSHCKERWRNLRACLSRYIKQQLSSEPQHKAYYLFEHMQFLLPYLKSAKTLIPVTSSGISEKSTLSSNSTNKISTNTIPHFFAFDTQVPSKIQIKLSKRDISSEIDETNYSSQTKTSNQKSQFFENIDDSDTYSASNFPDAEVQIDTNSQTMGFKQQPSQNSCENKSLNNDAFLEPKTIQFSNSNNNFRTLSSQQSCQRISSFYSENSDVDFFKSILSDIEEMSARQKRKFKIGVLHLIDEILENSPQKRSRGNSCGSTTNYLYKK